MAVALTSFALEIGSAVVAEGIETREQLGVAQALGVSLGQGYLLGRPEPLPWSSDRPGAARPDCAAWARHRS